MVPKRYFIEPSKEVTKLKIGKLYFVAK